MFDLFEEPQCHVSYIIITSSEVYFGGIFCTLWVGKYLTFNPWKKHEYTGCYRTSLSLLNKKWTWKVQWHYFPTLSGNGLNRQIYNVIPNHYQYCQLNAKLHFKTSSATKNSSLGTNSFDKSSYSHFFVRGSSVGITNDNFRISETVLDRKHM